VPGDIVVLNAGVAISADLRLIEASNLAADESTLTGESFVIR
jgi:P-type Ca2+ transporter type 2C